MTASHPGAPGAGPAGIVVGGSLRGHRDRPADLTAARRRVAAIAVVAVVLFAGWVGRDYLTGSWRYWAEHRSPLTPGLLCPTFPGHAMPGPGLVAAITDLGRGIPADAVARRYGCEAAASILGTQGRAALPRGARLK